MKARHARLGTGELASKREVQKITEKEMDRQMNGYTNNRPSVCHMSGTRQRALYALSQ